MDESKDSDEAIAAISSEEYIIIIFTLYLIKNINIHSFAQEIGVYHFYIKF